MCLEECTFSKRISMIYCQPFLILDSKIGLQESTNECEKLLLDEGIWKQAKPMNEQRAGVAAVTLKNKIYALGGGVCSGWDTTPTSTCEVYSTATGKWTYVAPMSYPRSGIMLIILTNAHNRVCCSCLQEQNICVWHWYYFQRRQAFMHCRSI